MKTKKKGKFKKNKGQYEEKNKGQRKQERAI